MKKLLSYIGYDGSGKTTAANNVLDVMGADFKLVSFSEPIRKQAFSIFGETPKDYRKWKDTYHPHINMTGRELLVEVGEGEKENFGKNVWADIAYEDIISKMKDLYNIVIPDCRFKQEAVACVDAADEFGYGVDFIWRGYRSKDYDPKPSETNLLAQEIEAMYFEEYGQFIYDYADVTKLVLKLMSGYER